MALQVKSVLLLLLLLLPPLLLSACEDESAWHDRDYRRADKTPSGFHVEFWDRGTLSTGFMTKAKVFALFDQAFVEAGDVFEAKNGVPLQIFLDTPHEQRLVFVIHDGWRYFSPYNGFVSGEAYDYGTVHLSFWSQRLLPYGTLPPNPWTVEARNGSLYYGGTPGGVTLCDLIVHEMGHVFFGPAFGH